VVSKRFCMIRWLPCWRTSTNPCCSRIRQTSEPERTRSLPNRHLDLSDENLVVKTSGDFGWGGRLKEEGERLYEIDSRFFNRPAFARNVEFRAQRHKSVVFTFDNRGQALRRLHAPSLHHSPGLSPRMQFHPSEARRGPTSKSMPPAPSERGGPAVFAGQAHLASGEHIPSPQSRGERSEPAGPRLFSSNFAASAWRIMARRTEAQAGRPKPVPRLPPSSASSTGTTSAGPKAGSPH